MLFKPRNVSSHFSALSYHLSHWCLLKYCLWILHTSWHTIHENLQLTTSKCMWGRVHGNLKHNYCLLMSQIRLWFAKTQTVTAIRNCKGSANPQHVCLFVLSHYVLTWPRNDEKQTYEPRASVFLKNQFFPSPLQPCTVHTACIYLPKMHGAKTLETLAGGLTIKPRASMHTRGQIYWSSLKQRGKNPL